MRHSFALALLTALALPARAGQTSAGPVLRAWNAPFAAVSPGLFTGVQGLLRTETGTALLAANPALSLLTELDSASPAHRSLMGALPFPEGFESRLTPELLADARAATAAALTLATIAGGRSELGSPLWKMAHAAEGRAIQILGAVSTGKLEVSALGDAARELAPFARSSRFDGSRLVLEMARAARIKGTLDAAERMASMLNFEGTETIEVGGYPWQAVELMDLHGQDAYNVLPILKSFDNPHQVAALRGALERGYQIRPIARGLARLDNPHQAQAVRILADGGYTLFDKMDTVQRVQGPLPVAALALMAADKRAIGPALDSLARISHERHVRAVRSMIRGSNAQMSYLIADKLPTVLGFSNDHQNAALDALIARSLPLRPFERALLRVSGAEHVTMLAKLADNLRMPASPDFLRSGVTVSLAAGFLAGLMSRLAGLLVLVGALLSLALRFWMNLSAARGVRRANRAWLDANPEIEAALGAIEDASFVDAR